MKHGDFGPDHDDFHIFTAVYIDAICPAFVFRYDPEKKIAGPEGGPVSRLAKGCRWDISSTSGKLTVTTWGNLGFLGILF